jgi:hypothetical protein
MNAGPQKKGSGARRAQHPGPHAPPVSVTWENRQRRRHGHPVAEVGIGVEFEPELGPTGPRAVTITVTPLETPPVRSFQELAASVHRHAAGSIHDLTHLTRR